MKTKIYYALSLLFILISCKSKFVYTTVELCKVLKNRDKVEYVNDKENLKKEIDSYSGIIKTELSDFYKTNYKYDMLFYEYPNGSDDDYFIQRLFYNAKTEKWIFYQQKNEFIITNKIGNKLKINFDNLEEGGFIAIGRSFHGGGAGVFLVKENGKMKLIASVLTQTCSLSNSPLSFLSNIQGELRRVVDAQSDDTE